MADLDPGGSFLGPIAAAQKMGESAEAAPLDRAHTVATTRYLNAQSGQQEYNLNAEKTAAALMAQRLGGDASGKGGGKVPNPSDFMLGMAQIYAQAGLPAKAEDAMKSVSQAQSHEATARAADARAESTRVGAAAKVADKAASMLGDVHDQAGWDAFNDTVARVTGKDSPWAAYPYNEGFVKSIQNMATTASQKANLRLKEMDEKLKREKFTADLAHKAVSEDLERKKVTIMEGREQRLAKIGGKDVGSPTSGDTAAAKRLLGAVPGLVGGDDLGTAAYDTAAVARGIRIKNPGVTMDEALRQAIQQKKDAGDFAVAKDPGTKIPFTNIKIPGTGGSPTPAYNVAQPLPKSGKAKDLVVGQHYKDGGTTMVWNGKGWDKIGPAGTGGGGGSSKDDDEDEE